MNRFSLSMPLLGAIVLFLAVAGLLLGVPVLAGNPPPDPSFEETLDNLLSDTASRLSIPALSVAVARDNETVYHRTIGENLTTESRFQIGSVSKSFTALAVMQLAEAGRINLDAPVSTYITEFEVSDRITVRHLLNQVSGMTEFDYMSSLPPDASFEDLVQDMNGITPSHPPGEHFAYFNQNYSLLGLVVERTSGIPYAQYLEKQIFRPLGLAHTCALGDADLSGHLSVFGFSVARPEPVIRYDIPAGYLTSTAQDMVWYLEAIRTAHPDTGVSPEGIAQMMDADPYGMGWMAGTISGRPAVHHGGSLPGFSTNAVMLTEDGTSIAILMNKQHMFNALVFYPDLTEAVVSVLTGQNPQDRLHLFWLVRLVLLFFLLNVLANLRAIGKLLFRPDRHTTLQRSIAVGRRLLLALALILLIPMGARILLGRGVTWHLAFLLMPDMILWLAIGISFSLIEAAIHTVYLVRGR